MSPPIICQETGKVCLHHSYDICKDHSKCPILNRKCPCDSHAADSALAIDAKRNNVKSVSVSIKENKENQCEWRDMCNLIFISIDKDGETYKCADAKGNIYIICSEDIECYQYKEDLPMPWITREKQF